VVDIDQPRRGAFVTEDTLMPRISFGAVLILIGMIGGLGSVCGTIAYETGSLRSTLEDGIATERGMREHEAAENGRRFKGIEDSQAEIRTDLRDIHGYLLSNRRGDLQHSTPDK
jgi:hypothetical protein